MHWPQQKSVGSSSFFAQGTSKDKLPPPDPQIVAQPVVLTTVTNASVYFSGGRHVVTTNNGTVISRCRISNTRLAEIPWQTHKHLVGTSLILGDSAGASNYYHWMLDLMPKLGYLAKIGINLDSIDHFLVRDAKTLFHIESLKKLGIDESRIVETAQQPHLSCDSVLVLPLKHQINMSMHPFVPNWVNSTFNDAVTNDKEKIKLYLKRAEGGRRGIKNQEAVESLLLEKGFSIVEINGLSIAEQAHLLNRAKVIVSPHGATLTNLVFAQPGAKVIELFGTHVFPYYYGLSNLCNLEYHALLQKPADYAKLVQIQTALEFGSAKNQNITQYQEFSVNLIALGNAITACS